MFTYKPQGTCSTLIEIEARGGVIERVKFTNGCNGNLQGIARLVEGMRIEDAVGKLRGISCGGGRTSCPDQLARALMQMTRD